MSKKQKRNILSYRPPYLSHLLASAMNPAHLESSYILEREVYASLNLTYILYHIFFEKSNVCHLIGK